MIWTLNQFTVAHFCEHLHWSVTVCVWKWAAKLFSWGTARMAFLSQTMAFLSHSWVVLNCEPWQHNSCNEFSLFAGPLTVHDQEKLWQIFPSLLFHKNEFENNYNYRGWVWIIIISHRNTVSVLNSEWLCYDYNDCLTICYYVTTCNPLVVLALVWSKLTYLLGISHLTTEAIVTQFSNDLMITINNNE